MDAEGLSSGLVEHMDCACGDRSEGNMAIGHRNAQWIVDVGGKDPAKFRHLTRVRIDHARSKQVGDINCAAVGHRDIAGNGQRA